jgi:hypothetical protein
MRMVKNDRHDSHVFCVEVDVRNPHPHLIKHPTLFLLFYRSQQDQQVLREFKQAVAELFPNSSTSTSSSTGSTAAAASSKKGFRTSGSHPAADYRLSRFYMWAQTKDSVFVAVYLPTGNSRTASLSGFSLQTCCINQE